MDSQSYFYSNIEYRFKCNFNGTAAALKQAEPVCAGNWQCQQGQCCATRDSWLLNAGENLTTAAGENFPMRNYCLDRAKVGVQQWARYPSNSTNDLRFDAQVTAKCAPEATFTPIPNLSFFVLEDDEIEGEVENFKTSLYIHLHDVQDDTTLSLYDETGVAKVFKPLQFHIHSPSEHTFNGKTYDVEVHIVHGAKNNTALSVIGIFFDVAAGGREDNWFIDELLEKFNPSNPNATIWEADHIHVQRLVQELDTRKFFHYDGSLTTPPCSEIVQWIVVDDPQPISPAQLKFFNDKWKSNSAFAGGFGNNRATQLLNGREIYYSGAYQTFGNTLLLIALFTLSLQF